MTCVDFEPELVAYHFGTVPLSTRALVEEHLLDCPGCLKSFLMLKRELESADEELPLPSAKSRARLRAAVAAQVQGRQVPLPWAWWHRPFAFASAAAMVLVAMVLTFRIATREVAAPLPQAQRAAPAGRLIVVESPVIADQPLRRAD